MPFGFDKEYLNWDACIRANADKDNPEAYCGWLKRETEKGGNVMRRPRLQRRRRVSRRGSGSENKAIGSLEYVSAYLDHTVVPEWKQLRRVGLYLEDDVDLLVSEMTILVEHLSDAIKVLEDAAADTRR